MELLVVIAIIGVLAALLLPSLSRAKAQSRSASCKNHLYQMGLALQMYVHENGNKYPGLGGPWFAALSPYYPLKWTDRAYHCPGYKGAIDLGLTQPHDPVGSYAYNYDGVQAYDAVVRSPVNLGLGGPGKSGQRVAISESQVKVPSEMLSIGESRHRGERGVANDSGVFAMYCGNIGGYYDYYGKPPLPERHGKNYNQLFCDGHVAPMDPRILFNPTNSAALWNNDHQPHPELWLGLDLPGQ